MGRENSQTKGRPGDVGKGERAEKVLEGILFLSPGKKSGIIKSQPDFLIPFSVELSRNGL